MALTVCKSLTPLSVFLAFISLFLILPLVPLVLHGLLKSIKLKMHKLLFIMYWMTCFVLLIAGISYPVHQILNFTYFGSCDDFNRIPITVTVALGSYLISLVFICTLYFFRLFLTFKDSEFVLSKSVLVLMIAGILIHFMLAVFTIYFDVQLWWALKNKAHAPEHFAKLMFITFYGLIAFIAMNCIYNIVLLSIFLRWICSLNNAVKSQNNILNIIKPSVVYTLCLVLSFSSTVPVFVMLFIRLSVSDSNELYMLHLTFIAVNIFANSLSIQLQFVHFQHSCYRYCKCCRCGSGFVAYFVKPKDNQQNIKSDDRVPGVGSKSTTTRNTVTTSVPPTLPKLKLNESPTTFDKSNTTNVGWNMN
eukprot:77150_1